MKKFEIPKKVPELKSPPKFRRTIKVILTDFLSFLKNTNTFSLAIAFVSASTINQLVSAIVNGIILPTIELIIPNSGYGSFSVTIKNSTFLLGSVLDAFIHMLIIMFIIYIFAKYITKDEKLLEKATPKTAKVSVPKS